MEMNGTTMEELRTMQAIQSISHKLPDLTLRDLFAMQAMNGLLSGNWYTFNEIAKSAYQMADAMLVARKDK